MPTFKTKGRAGWAAIMQYFDKIPEGDEKQRDVSITLHRIKRTVSQNRLYRLWLSSIADETGNSTEDLHEAFKVMLLGTKQFMIGEISASTSISTTSLDTKQFTSFLERLEAWVTAELGIILPHPEDMFWTDFEQKYGSL